MPQIKVNASHTRVLKHREHQALHFHVAFEARMAIQLGADLQRLPRVRKAGRQRMQDATGVTKPCYPLAVEQVRVDTRHLWCDIGAQAHVAAGNLVHQLEGGKVQVTAGTRKQGFHILQQWGHDQLITMQTKDLQHLAAQTLDAQRFRRENVFEELGQQPVAHDGLTIYLTK